MAPALHPVIGFWISSGNDIPSGSDSKTAVRGAEYTGETFWVMFPSLENLDLQIETWDDIRRCDKAVFKCLHRTTTCVR